jgi:hypothetical protein
MTGGDNDTTNGGSMPNGNAALALALGAGAGLGLWYLLRDDDAEKTTTPATPSGAAPAVPSVPAVQPPAAASPPPCALRLDARGLSADGVAIDVPTAVAWCKAAGRVDLIYAKDGPAQVYLDLNAALAKAGVAVSVRRS